MAIVRKVKQNWRAKPRLLPDNLSRLQFTERIAFMVRMETRAQLIALSYLRGAQGGYGSLVREFLGREIRRYVAVELDPEERQEYENILESVMAGLTVSRMEMQARIQKEREQEAAMIPDRSDQFVNDDFMGGDPGEEP